ncbi:MAG TPA: hypothetical protein P5136_01485 [Methanofastidiosum sp.]|nr:hypothetical protein [Methanofastidiosum sp.]
MKTLEDSSKEAAITESVTDSAGRKYIKLKKSDIYFHPETLVAVATIIASQLLERNLRNERFRFHYGNQKTGEAWGDIETGYIGRSTGPIKIPLVIYNARSHGGPALLDNCIVKIERSKGKEIVWEHPDYHRTPEELLTKKLLRIKID